MPNGQVVHRVRCAAVGTHGGVRRTAAETPIAEMMHIMARPCRTERAP